jgi:hypothetical protein
MKEQYDWHHKDGNKHNNDPANIERIRRHVHCIEHVGLREDLQAYLVYERCNEYERSFLVAYMFEINNGKKIKKRYGASWKKINRFNYYNA